VIHDEPEPVNLLSGRVSTLAAGVPEACHLRTAPFFDYVHNDASGWLLRDGAGCGTPMLTGSFEGRVDTETPVSHGCAPEGCELVDAYATGQQVVVQTRTELLSFDFLGALRSRVPITPDRRSVVLPDDSNRCCWRPACCPGRTRHCPGTPRSTSGTRPPVPEPAG
jgi:hypothetical protein